MKKGYKYYLIFKNGFMPKILTRKEINNCGYNQNEYKFIGFENLMTAQTKLFTLL